MTIEMEAGASQLQCSMRPISPHLINYCGQIGLPAGIRGLRIPSLDSTFKGVARAMRKC
jgi:hypothetical protein